LTIAIAVPHAAQRRDVQRRHTNGRRRQPTTPHLQSDFQICQIDFQLPGRAGDSRQTREVRQNVDTA
jgi:hypothetical protein